MYLPAFMGVAMAAKAISPEIPLLVLALLSTGAELLRASAALVPLARSVLQYESVLLYICFAALAALAAGAAVRVSPISSSAKNASTAAMCVLWQLLISSTLFPRNDGIVLYHTWSGEAVRLKALADLDIASPSFEALGLTSSPARGAMVECALTLLMLFSGFLMAGDCIYLRPELRHRVSRRQKRSFAALLLLLLALSAAPLAFQLLDLSKRNVFFLQVIYAMLCFEALIICQLADLSPAHPTSQSSAKKQN
ncbi:hypothetical protein FVE85_9329 [Porphyridium purpureum]|uniref:Uncharacterized protein n=1 Tax=Porphyridium purpureum TaxID=35688 RepID=A0A5J4YRL4_PORPP|nr:hypothetical protein FVE85_9329 [Porphyridium purpureum]|eukprot:POR9370..scf222_8